MESYFKIAYSEQAQRSTKWKQWRVSFQMICDRKTFFVSEYLIESVQYAPPTSMHPAQIYLFKVNNRYIIEKGAKYVQS